MLVGTQAFTCLANMLGVAFEKESLRTADIDIVHDTSIPLGITEPSNTQMLERLRGHDSRFFAVPRIDAREPSTSFNVRGKDLRVDFLTPAGSSTRSTKPVYLAHLGVAAQPLLGLDYIIDSSVDAAVLAAGGILVNVPTPARFAFHKLWVSTQRPASEAGKARKDLRQAQHILEVLIDDRPNDVVSAWKAAHKRRGLSRGMDAGVKRISSVLRERLMTLVRETS